MPKYAIDDLTPNDVATGAVFDLDRQFYPEHLIWSHGMWLGLIKDEDSVVKKAIRLPNQPQSMIGNVLVTVDEDRRTNYQKPCFLVYTITIAKDYQRQGLATRLFHEVSQTIAREQAEGKYLDIDIIDLSLERTDLAAHCLYKKCGFEEYSFSKAKGSKFYMQQSVDSFHRNIAALMATPKQDRTQLEEPERRLSDLSAAFDTLVIDKPDVLSIAAVKPLVFSPNVVDVESLLQSSQCPINTVRPRSNSYP